MVVTLRYVLVLHLACTAVLCEDIIPFSNFRIACISITDYKTIVKNRCKPLSSNGVSADADEAVTADEPESEPMGTLEPAGPFDAHAAQHSRRALI